MNQNRLQTLMLHLVAAGAWLGMCCSGAAAVEPTAGELAAARAWAENAFVKTAEGTPFFSFSVGGKPWPELVKDWKRTDSSRQLDDARTERTATYTSPQGDLELRCVSIEYADFPTVEWTLYFKNIGTNDSPIVADICAIDVPFKSDGVREFLLHHQVGSPATLIDFAPRQTLMTPGSRLRFGGAGGRPTSSDWAYFNLERDEQGVLVAVGWPGQWFAEFVRDDQHGIHLQAGQETTHFTLHPGEEFRSPLIVLQFWQDRDWIDAQNIWRRWMVKHNLPRPGGRDLAPAAFACSSHQFGEMIGANEQNQIDFIDGYRDNGLPIDYWWMDAGWYPCDGNWGKTGTWEIDPQRFPRGFRPISEHAHGRDTKVLVWFEPERVAKGTWLMTEHPEWVIPSPNTPGETDNLLDLGNEEARRWLTDHVSQIIDDEGINLYRQDSNIDPLRFWTSRDSADRQGITENGHVRGYLAYWDELIRRHPEVPLDSCASGGRRNDIESMRRAVPRTRSDYLIEPVGEQCHTYGLAFWLPYYGTGFMDVVTEKEKREGFEGFWASLSNINSPQPTVVGESLAVGRTGRYGGNAYGLDDRYPFRSTMCPSMTYCLDVRKDDLDYQRLQKLFAEWRELAPIMLADYYPLTTFSTGTDVWMAWQFNRPEQGDGMVQAFRRQDSPHVAADFRLRGLDPAAQYEVTDVDSLQVRQLSGKELMQQGIRVEIDERPQAAVLQYQKIAAQ